MGNIGRGVWTKGRIQQASRGSNPLTNKPLKKYLRLPMHACIEDAENPEKRRNGTEQKEWRLDRFSRKNHCFL